MIIYIYVTNSGLAIRTYTIALIMLTDLMIFLFMSESFSLTTLY